MILNYSIVRTLFGLLALSAARITPLHVESVYVELYVILSLSSRAKEIEADLKVSAENGFRASRAKSRGATSKSRFRNSAFSDIRGHGPLFQDVVNLRRHDGR